MNDALAAQILHPPSDIQHELDQGLQGQVLGDRQQTLRGLADTRGDVKSGSDPYKRLVSQAGQQQEGVQVAVLHEGQNHHGDRQPLTQAPVETHSCWTGTDQGLKNHWPLSCLNL